MSKASSMSNLPVYVVIMTCLLCIVSWNMRSLNTARPYIKQLMQNSDIVVLSEHRLYRNELHKLEGIDEDFQIRAKCSKDLCVENQASINGHCGIAICWRNTFSKMVNEIECQSDRICCIEIIGGCDGKNLYVIGVYLPQRNSNISSFDEELETLGNIVCECLVKGEVLIIGDLNCHFGAENGSRFWGSSTPNAKKMLQWIVNSNMVIIDAEEHVKGPNYTFNVEGVGRSYIDHCVGSSHISSLVKSCEVCNDCILNTSDHLPIKVEIECKTKPDAKLEEKSSRVQWHKMDQEKIKALYTEKLDNCIIPYLIEAELIYKQNKGVKKDGVKADLDRILNDITGSINGICKGLTSTKSNSHLKPFWDKELNEASKLEKLLHREWSAAGRLRGDNAIFAVYKQAKKEFRKKIKKKQYEYEVKNMADLKTSKDINQQYFWHLVNKSKGKNKSIHPIKVEKDKTLTDKNQIREAWRIYFEKLYTPAYPQDARKFVSFIKNKVREYEQNKTIGKWLEIPFQLMETQTVIKTLKCRKSPGWDNIVAEHIIFAGKIFQKLLTVLCNIIIKFEVIPDHFKKGVIIPIPKGDKNLTNQDNYRGITLTSTYCKVFEKLLLIRSEKEIKSKISTLQGASQEKCSSLNTAWLIQEAISCNLENESTIYVGLLDTKKAFDTVWIDGLFYMLHEKGIQGKIWRVLREMYKTFRGCVQIDSINSEWFTAIMGIHQGAPWSMLLYQLFNDNLLRELQNARHGCSIGNITVTCPAFADDIALIAMSKHGLQKLINIAQAYSTKWNYQYNVNKCAFLVFGKDKCPSKGITIDKAELNQSNKETHLGIVLTNNKCEISNLVSKKAEQCKQMCYLTMGIGNPIVPINPIISSKIYYQAIVPKLVYGLDVLQIESHDVDVLESCHFNASKIFQQLPQQTAGIGSTSTIGWNSIESYIDIMRIMFLWRILLLPTKCIYKTVLLLRIQNYFVTNKPHLGPTWKALNTCRKYNLLNAVIDAVTAGVYISSKVWKSIVNKTVLEYYVKRWKIIYQLINL